MACIKYLLNFFNGYNLFTFQLKRQSHLCYKDREKLCSQMHAACTGKRTMTEKDVVKVGYIIYISISTYHHRQ